MLEILDYSKFNRLKNTILLIICIFVFFNFSCTQAPEFNYVRQFPEIEPEGNFYDFIRAVKSDNENIIFSMLSPKIFVYVQDKPKIQKELFQNISRILKPIFQFYTFTKSFESFSYMYDTNGKFQNAKAYTEFSGLLTIIQMSDELKVSSEPVISFIWENIGNNWVIVNLALNSQNLLNLAKKS